MDMDGAAGLLSLPGFYGGGYRAGYYHGAAALYRGGRYYHSGGWHGGYHGYHGGVYRR